VLSPVAFTPLGEPGVAAASAFLDVSGLRILVVLEVDEHAVNQIIKKALAATAQSATVFHQLRGCLILNIVFIALLLFL
jgi:hypothetical protein